MRILGEHWRLKCIALLIAVMLKVYFYSQNNSISTELVVPLDIRNNAASMMIVSPPNAERGLFLRAKIEGPSSLVQQVERANNRATINIDPDAGPRFVKVFDFETLARQLRLPQGVELRSVDPLRLEFQLEQVQRKELTVVPQRFGEPAPGFEVHSIEAFPSAIRAQGPQSELLGISQVLSDRVDISGLTQSKKFEVGLVDIGSSTVFEVNRVSVQVVIIPIQERRSLSNVKVKVLAPSGFAATVLPARVNVVLSGPAAQLEKLNSDDIEVVADATTLAPGKHRVQVQAHLPAGILLEKTDPEETLVTVVSQGNG